MRRNKSEIYLHLIWTTKGREALITSENERDLFRCISSEVKRCRCVVCAIGGMSDHVHLVARLPTTVTAAELMKQVKGVSSAFANDLPPPHSRFRWQEGYGVFSISPWEVATAVDYVVHQKEHHASNKTKPAWEEADEEV